jgi:hypothetical protein
VHECLAPCEAPRVNHSGEKMFRFQTQTARDASGARIRGGLKAKSGRGRSFKDAERISLPCLVLQQERRVSAYLKQRANPRAQRWSWERAIDAALQGLWLHPIKGARWHLASHDHRRHEKPSLHRAACALQM